ncbi:C40 family peptidase [Kaustia mangrovi]|uniref:C40 family peptidase n=1 Tax=Kaustia mangrovi TaxID=2593653 RepID=A0A7S8HD24_9HYPH|nr:NlpC/P60 family protein [Kaustia mangrovi]QPC43858.1 C40 family peptidase [Kaustia mangrovi]
MTNAPDPRLHPYRPDLAAAWLRGRVPAERFVEGQSYHVIAPALGLRRRPEPDAALLTEALMGERVRVFDERDGWAWVQIEEDGYVGYARAGSLAPEAQPATHRVSVPRTFLYPQPDVKSQPVTGVGLNARLAIAGTEGPFAVLADGRYVYARHVRPLRDYAQDYVAVAETLLHVPYLWGGKGFTGVDCSGLVQLALHAAGHPCPRDSDMQEAALGVPVDAHGFAALHRGDLVFWKGHVGLMVDGERFLHANGHHMQVVIEPLHEAVDRIARLYGNVTGIRRMVPE